MKTDIVIFFNVNSMLFEIVWIHFLLIPYCFLHHFLSLKPTLPFKLQQPPIALLSSATHHPFGRWKYLWRNRTLLGIRSRFSLITDDPVLPIKEELSRHLGNVGPKGELPEVTINLVGIVALKIRRSERNTTSRLRDCFGGKLGINLMNSLFYDLFIFFLNENNICYHIFLCYVKVHTF